MLRFIIKRLLITIPTILVVITITWGLVRLAPGNFYTGEKKLPPAIEQNIREKYGLDKPWYEQYGRTMWNIVRHFDFGTSLTYPGQSVNAIIARSLPISATVGLLAYLLALIVGITIGVIAALRPNSGWDYASMAVAMLGISIPNFVLGPILVLIFSLTLYWLPPSRWEGFPSRNLDSAGINLGRNLHGLHRQIDARGNARSITFRLHPDSTSQGFKRGAGSQASRASRRTDAGGLVYRTRASVPADRHGRS